MWQIKRVPMSSTHQFLGRLLQKNMTKVVKYYTKNISARSCNNVTGILLGGHDNWMPGQSQDMHDKVMNTEAYGY